MARRHSDTTDDAGAQGGEDEDAAERPASYASHKRPFEALQEPEIGGGETQQTTTTKGQSLDSDDTAVAVCLPGGDQLSMECVHWSQFSLIAKTIEAGATTICFDEAHADHDALFLPPTELLSTIREILMVSASADGNAPPALPWYRHTPLAHLELALGYLMATSAVTKMLHKQFRHTWSQPYDKGNLDRLVEIYELLVTRGGQAATALPRGVLGGHVPHWLACRFSCEYSIPRRLAFLRHYTDDRTDVYLDASALFGLRVEQFEDELRRIGGPRVLEAPLAHCVVAGGSLVAGFTGARYPSMDVDIFLLHHEHQAGTLARLVDFFLADGYHMAQKGESVFVAVKEDAVVQLIVTAHRQAMDVTNDFDMDYVQAMWLHGQVFVSLVAARAWESRVCHLSMERSLPFKRAQKARLKGFLVAVPSSLMPDEDDDEDGAPAFTGRERVANTHGRTSAEVQEDLAAVFDATRPVLGGAGLVATPLRELGHYAAPNPTISVKPLRFPPTSIFETGLFAGPTTVSPKVHATANGGQKARNCVSGLTLVVSDNQTLHSLAASWEWGRWRQSMQAMITTASEKAGVGLPTSLYRIKCTSHTVWYDDNDCVVAEPADDGPILVQIKATPSHYCYRQHDRDNSGSIKWVAVAVKLFH